MNDRTPSPTDIAIIGMAGRFPKARNVEEFWQRLCKGEDCISFFSEPSAGKGAGGGVSARGILENPEFFDAAFFDVKPKEAEVMDPQHRVFLECAWEALEDAGYDSAKFDGDIGVFAGMSMNTYLAHNVLTHPELIELFGEYQTMLANDKDFLPTRVSYKLNLTGPSLNIQTACSTSLVAVCVACQHLLNQQCDMALAGAVSIRFPQRQGHVHQQGGIGSADGHCRPFDASATGTVAGEGAGIVVLKRMDDALRDQDSIYAVIKGFATNNDGANKIGYTAPSVNGQAEVIATAQAMAAVEPEEISYVEAHGTATPLGDPIEIEALKKAFASDSAGKNYCAIGAVKSNIGHLDAAAGVAGLIKTALALHHEKIPATVHFKSPNPQIDFVNSPFFVNATLRDWRRQTEPRRAGASSFGIGGTNAHVVLEEAPLAASENPPKEDQLLLLSARTESALKAAIANLATHLGSHPELSLADVAHTLRVGRKEFGHRHAIVCSDLSEAVAMLESTCPKQVLLGRGKDGSPSIVFMFPGQGAQRVDMGRELYQRESAFRAEVDQCAEILKPELSCDLRQVLFPPEGEHVEAAAQLVQTSLTQPALFVVEYALARLWMSWGIRPDVMIGHSIGEYVAACLAGVFPLAEALKLVAARGRLMQRQPPGALLAVHLSEAEARALLNDQLSLATINAPRRCVISGPREAIDSLQSTLNKREIPGTLLQTSHAFHSFMMDSALEPFTKLVEQLTLHPPQIPFISNVSGTWIEDDEAVDPGYWARHLRQTVRFSDGIAQLSRNADRLFIEVGPGRILSSLVKQQTESGRASCVVSTLDGQTADRRSLLSALGRVWSVGVSVDWKKIFGKEQPRRVHLPAYPFERKRYFVEPASGASAPIESNDVREDYRASAHPEPILVETHEHDADRALGNPQTQGIARRLRTLLSDLSGMNLAALNGETFTELGFDSLFLTQVSLAIEKQLNVQVAFRELLEEFSTVDRLATHIAARLATASAGQRQGGTFTTEAPAHPEVPVIKLPLTDAQRDMWFASQMSDGASCTFNECRLVRFQGKVEVERLRSALRLLVERHEALRTTFAPDGNTQLVHSGMPLNFVCGNPREAVDLRTVQSEEASTPFDLVEGPLFRARLLHTDDEHDVLTVTIHHLVCDGSSFSILLRELALAYASADHASDAELPTALKFSDYVRRKTERLATDSDDTAETYWVREFKEIPPLLDLPGKGSRRETLTFEGARESLVLSTALVDGLRQLSARHGCTLFTTLLAGFTAFLRQLTSRSDIVVGVPVADRGHDGGASLIGHCITFLPVRTAVDEGQGFVEHLARVRKKFLDAHEHRRFSFGNLIQKLNAPRQPGRMPLVSVTLNVERQDERFDFGGMQAELTVNPDSLTNFDLNCNVAELGSALRVDFQYRCCLFDAERVRGWLKQFQQALESIKSRPQQRLGEILTFPQALPFWQQDRRERDVSSGDEPVAVVAAFEPASTPVQLAVARIWQDLLGAKRIGVHDNFFELGGHSLLMIQVLGRIRGKFQANVSIRRFFETPTVAGLAEAVEEKLTDEIADMSESEAQNLLRLAK
ncbi:MAG TPA: condensation domain-containing protein [Verrucomicrobiae bacterium]|nr:condensation domain-containing protein [Verrucomicrobiae bacterium]